MAQSVFGGIAAQERFVTQEQLQDALETMKKLEELGMPEKLGVIMVKKGYMTQAQVKQVLALQGREKRSVIPGYEIIEKIGQGAFGSVYKARQLSLDRPVAIKILPPQLAKNANFIARFMREARAVAKLTHPNIVQGIDVNQAGQYYYFVMEYIDGETVSDVLKRDRRLDEKRAVGITRQIAEALVHVHKHGVIHRDIKPDNIMVTKNGTAKLCDLGLAKSTSGADMLTRVRGAIGTPHYISPEQARGQPDIDIRSDIYSLGATLYHMVAGRTPYEGKSAAVVMTKHLTDDIPSPQDVIQTLSDGVCHIIEKCMAKAREDRYQKPEDLARDAERVLKKQSPVSPRLAAGRSSIMRAVKRAEIRKRRGRETSAPPPTRRRGAGVWAIIAVCSLVAAGVVAALVLPMGKKPGPRPKERPVPAAAVPEPPPGPAAQEPGEDEGELLLKEALKYATASPDDYPGVVSRLEALLQGTSGVVKLQAEDALRACRARREEALKQAISEARKKAERSARDLRFARALRVFDSIPQKLLPEGPDALRGEKERISKLASAKLKGLSAKATSACERGDFAGAREIIARLAAFGLAEAEAERARLTGFVERAEKEAARRLARERALDADREHASLVAAAAALARASRFGEAAKTCEGALAREELSQWREEFDKLRGDYSRCQELEQAAVDALGRAARTGEFVYVHKGKDELKVRVARLDGRDLYVEKSGAELKFSLDDLTPYDIMRLARLRFAKPKEKYDYALLLYFDGQTSKARDLFEKAAQDPSLKPACDYYLRRISGAETKAREEEALKLLAQARKEHAAGDTKALGRTLAKLDSYRDTAVYRENYASRAPPVPRPLRTVKLPMKTGDRRWQLSDDKWSFSGNELRGSSLAGVLWTVLRWEEYVLEGEWLAEEGTKEVIFIARTTKNRWQDSAACVAVGPGSAQVRRYKGGAAALAEEQVNLPNGRWRKFRLDVSDGTVAFHMGGRTVVRGKWLPGPRGMLGFAVRGKVRLRNLVVRVLKKTERKGK